MITIAWDVDDILNDLMRRWLVEKWLPEHPDCKVRFEEIIENPPERLVGCSREEYLKSLDVFRLSKSHSDMKPDPEILDWFEKRGDYARHVALSSVSTRAAHVSACWVIKNFGKWIRSFNFIPSPRVDERIFMQDRTKGDYLKWLDRVDVLVEDSGQNILDAKALGIKGILIGRPWNKSTLSVGDALKEIDDIIRKGS